MKLASEFSVPAPAEKVFPLFFDPDTMRGCIPGCEELVREDERTYRGRLVNEIAHVRFSAGFAAAIQSVTDEEATKEVTALVKGEDRRLGSSIKIDARLAVRPDGDDTSVIAYEMDMALWGKLGRLGEPIIRRRSREVEVEFAKSLAAACGVPVERAEPARTSTAAGRTSTAAGRASTAAGRAATTTAPVVTSPVPKAAVAAALVAALALLVAVLRRGR
ncbi:MAG TPA: SRPBCC domain-containing protein [Actinophytocola sp.]|nr:SRPBCC domain-containing protein [Actinophytocola sp.]